jgi:hypothetical protein
MALMHCAARLCKAKLEKGDCSIKGGKGGQEEVGRWICPFRVVIDNDKSVDDGPSVADCR